MKEGKREEWMAGDGTGRVARIKERRKGKRGGSEVKGGWKKAEIRAVVWGEEERGGYLESTIKDNK